MPAKRLDSNALKAGFARWLAHAHDVRAIHVGDPVFPSGGFSSEIAIVDATWNDAGKTIASAWVIRMAPLSNTSTHSNYNLLAQDAAMRLAATTGAALPQPFTTETDPQWLGAPFMVMPKVSGNIIGGATPRDPWLTQLDTATQQRVCTNFIDAIAAIHSAPITTAAAQTIPARDNAADLVYWSDYLQWSAIESDQVLCDVLAWCRQNKPAIDPEPVLLWGDVRYGNVIYSDDGEAKAVLDWDMSTIGPAEHDLGWLFAHEEMIGKLLRMKVPGFLDREQILDRYQQKTGRHLQDLYWYQTFALFRGAALLTRIDLLRRQAGEEPMFPSVGANPLYQELLSRIEKR